MLLLSLLIAAAYCELRKEARISRDMTFTSARNLLAILRLSTALARLRISNVVEKDDVNEAIRLMQMSKESINNTIDQVRRPPNPNDRIFAIIRELAGDRKTVKISDIVEHCSTKGYNPGQIDACIDEYEELNVWQVSQARTKITFI